MKILMKCNLLERQKQELYQMFKEDVFIDGPFKQEEIKDADVIIGNPDLSMDLYSDKLKALMLISAGSDSYCKEGVLHPSTILTNASGAYGKCIGEYVVGMMITLSKQFKHFSNLMNQQTWGERIGGKEIYNSRVLIVGYGDIGNECAKRLKAFNAHIVGIKKRLCELPECVDELYTMEALDKQLSLADYVILCLPHSNQTYHIMNKERLLMMKKDVILINVGRGSAIDTDALVEVLEQGHLFSVGLDVVEQEPLDPSHPLWKKDNVLLTPHIAGSFSWDSVKEFYYALLKRNLQHLHNHEPLENIVDKKTGYRKETIYQK